MPKWRTDRNNHFQNSGHFYAPDTHFSSGYPNKYRVLIYSREFVFFKTNWVRHPFFIWVSKKYRFLISLRELVILPKTNLEKLSRMPSPGIGMAGYPFLKDISGYRVSKSVSQLRKIKKSKKNSEIPVMEWVSRPNIHSPKAYHLIPIPQVGITYSHQYFWPKF